MKQKLLLLASASLFLSLHLNAQPATQVKSGNQVYKLQYNNIKIGNPDYAGRVLQAWKQYDNNEMDMATSLLADNAVGYFADGTVIKGADNLNELFRDVRNSFASVNEEVYACTTLKTPDNADHEFVVIWGKETDTKKDGSIQKMRIHEVWSFNKEGRVDEVFQYVIPETPANKTADQEAKVNNRDQSYPILQNISIGNPAYSATVLKVWKDFENNSLDNTKLHFADDVVAYSAYGTVVEGKDNMFKTSNAYRNSLAAVKFQITACTTLKSPNDPDHEIVMIWAEVNYTNKDGSIEKANAHEAWYFNKEGKIDKFYQFAAAMPKENKN